MTVLRPTIIVLIRSLPERRLSFISTLGGEGGMEGGKVSWPERGVIRTKTRTVKS